MPAHRRRRNANSEHARKSAVGEGASFVGRPETVVCEAISLVLLVLTSVVLACVGQDVFLIANRKSSEFLTYLIFINSK